MTFNGFRRSFLIGSVAVAAALALVVPSGAHGRGHGQGPCTGQGPCKGEHHPMMGAGPLGMSLDRAFDQAKLTDPQKATLEGIRHQAQQLRDDARTQMKSLHTAISAELAKPEPNLDSLASKLDTAHEQMRKGFQSIQSSYLSLYDQLSPDQKQTVASTLRDDFQRMAQKHEHWMQRRGSPPPADGSGSGS